MRSLARRIFGCNALRLSASRRGRRLSVDNQIRRDRLGMARRPRHPSKEIEAAVAFAEAEGWTWIKAKGHAWGRLRCPFNDPACRCGEFCQQSVWSTPRDPDSHARAIRRIVEGCLRLQTGGKEGQAP